MNMNKLILGTVAAGLLTVGMSFADGPVMGPKDADKVKLEELKGKLEAAREGMKARHDSLASEEKGEIEKRITEHKGDIKEDKDERDAVREKIKAAVEEFKTKVKDGHDSDRAEMAHELGDKIKAIHDKARESEKAEFDAKKKDRAADMDKNKAEIEKKMAEHKADFDAKKKEIEDKRAEFEKAHGTHMGPDLTEAEKAALKAKFEEWAKSHAADHDSLAMHH